MAESYEQLLKRAQKAEATLEEAFTLLDALYKTAWREGWEPGESTTEVCTRVHNFLCNHNRDPFVEKSK